MARHGVTPPSSTFLPPKSNLREPPAVSSYLRLDLTRSAAAGLGRCISGLADENEIGIFDAKRYFSEDHDAGRCDLYRRVSSSSSDGYPRHGLSFSFSSTPTASSDASWNSQFGLLPNPSSGSLAVSVDALPLRNPSKSPSSASRHRLFRGNCPCYGKKSVEVEEKCSEPVRGEELGLSSTPKRTAPEEMKNDEVIKAKISSGSGNFSSSNRFSLEVGRRMVDSGSQFRDCGGFSFPILNPPPMNSSQKPARKSLEVFRPTNWSAYSLSTLPELQRRTAVFTFSSEVDRQSFSFPVFSRSPPPPDDDMASDTSSDLFEISSFSTQTTQLRHNSLDKIQPDLGAVTPPRTSVTPSDCYAPSEVSIDWSVITAEGFDRASQANFSSAASDFGELRSAREERERYAAAADGRRRRGSLLGCRNEKAVSVVGPNPACFRPEHIRSGVNHPLRAR